MSLRGQRFQVNIDDGPDQDNEYLSGAKPNLLGDIKEKVPRRAPSPPRLTGGNTGFPRHKDRKQSYLNEAQLHSSQQSTGNASVLSNQNSDPSINQHNKQRLAEMSEEEIENSKRDLMSSLDSSVIETLLKRASIEDGNTCPSPSKDASPSAKTDVKNSRPKSNLQEKDYPLVNSTSLSEAENFAHEDVPPLHPPADLRPVSSKEPLPALSNIHFPRAPPPPELDPNDPEFLTKLHSTYFPALPSDPNSLAWMAPVKESEQASYSPSQETLIPSCLRFDFRGRLLPPRLSAQIPASKGLHHHGDTPESAGYTVPELSHLARSAVTAQRCVAYQTLGRILYRLGRGDFGAEGEDLCEGLWDLIDRGKILPNIIEAAARENEGNRSVWATATDAVWLWRKGGGRRWKGR